MLTQTGNAFDVERPAKVLDPTPMVLMLGTEAPEVLNRSRKTHVLAYGLASRATLAMRTERQIGQPTKKGRIIKFKMYRTLFTYALGALIQLPLYAQPSGAQDQQVTVVTNANADGIAIPSGFLGLSFETADMLPKADGTYAYFRPSNHNLVNIIRTIGIRSLRIGGNTSDRPGVPVPGARDIDQLFAFAQSAGVKVIYTLRLRDSSPEEAARLAKYLEGHYAEDISCFVVGNEPDVYERQYPHYRDDLNRYLAAILAPDVAPTAKICGPSTTPGYSEWSNNFVSDFGPAGHVLWVTQHSYPGGSANKVSNPSAERERILSPSFADNYQKLADSFVPAVENSHMQYRIEETNSFFNGGAKNVSNTFASSLWALNYLYWWAAHHSQGVNFHTGDYVAAGADQTICWYGMFHTLTDGGYELRPIAYAMKAFDLTSHGVLLPINGLPANTRLNVYAVADHVSHELYLTMVNGGDTRVTLALNPQTKYPRAEYMLLAPPNGDLGATSGITLGGSEISGDGHWSGKWLREPLDHGHLRITLQPATALLVRLPLSE